MSDWHNKIDVTYSVSTFSVTSTPQRSQMIPLYRILLYFPQAHSKSFTGPKFFHRKDHHAQACAYGS
jgi:hypothetical protein